jgi:two-component system sensor histidine kinase AlgZ
MISIDDRIRQVIHKYGYWLFAFVMGFFLILLEEVEDIEPVFSIAAFFYWALLFYWGTKWIFGQIKSALSQKKDKANMELLHLQSQVSPHFFFNTLNNLYGLVAKDPKKAQQLILKLSDMMRYSIYEGQKDWVTLEQELEYLDNYIQLHNARYHKKTDIKLKHDIRIEGKKVMPLLFIILLENAFKHGVETLTEHAFVHIQLTATEEEIHFSVKNNFDKDGVTEAVGIGLKNLKRRLELAYPGKHTLLYTATNDTYTAQLTLKSK